MRRTCLHLPACDGGCHVLKATREPPSFPLSRVIDIPHPRLPRCLAPTSHRRIIWSHRTDAPPSVSLAPVLEMHCWQIKKKPLADSPGPPPTPSILCTPPPVPESMPGPQGSFLLSSYSSSATPSVPPGAEWWHIQWQLRKFPAGLWCTRPHKVLKFFFVFFSLRRPGLTPHAHNKKRLYVFHWARTIRVQQ